MACSIHRILEMDKVHVAVSQFMHKLNIYCIFSTETSYYVGYNNLIYSFK